ncbi:hypothetical protein EMIHUDRAFT_260683, partial [Emiliania huxleyi CCMP1516]|uniref:Uncharacterized protein n=2 Tax=Emiliania huxleyi TaxID=2903 RepID=A0A0D3KSF4_EMIH1
PPVLCAGFEGSVLSGVAKGLFEWGAKKEKGNQDEGPGEGGEGGEGKETGGEEKDGAAAGCAEGAPLLTEQDESTKTPGLFLVGPAVRHDGTTATYASSPGRRDATLCLGFAARSETSGLIEITSFISLNVICDKGAAHRRILYTEAVPDSVVDPWARVVEVNVLITGSSHLISDISYSYHASTTPPRVCGELAGLTPIVLKVP